MILKRPKINLGLPMPYKAMATTKPEKQLLSYSKYCPIK